MLKELWSQLGKHPVEVLSGLLLAALGVLLTVAGADSANPEYLLYVGALGTAFGGVVLSWTVSKEVSKQQAIQEIGSQLGLVSKTLGQAAGQMSRVVDQCSDHSMPSETGFALVGQSASLVGAQVSAIQGILGDPFEVGDLLSTISEMENLAERLDRRDKRENAADSLDGGSEVVELKSRLEDIRAELTGVSSSKSRVTEQPDCPNCGRQATVSIGPYAGDTAATQCPHCGSRFNAHRRWDGSVFSRPIGGTTSAPLLPSGEASASSEHAVPVTHECPKCGQEVRVLTRAGDGNHKFAVCLDCGASLIFDLKHGGVTTDGSFEKQVGQPIARYGSGGTGARPIIRCVSCGREMRGVIRRDSDHYAIDNRCRRLYVVSNESLLAWRREHEPSTISNTTEA